MNNETLTRYGKKLMQYVYDPVPRNTDDDPIWCLGQEYESHPDASATPALEATTTTTTTTSPPHSDSEHSAVDSGLSNPSRSPRSDTASSLADDESFVRVEERHPDGVELGWPADFLRDVESRIWLTYRKDFPPITKSNDADALSGMSFFTSLKHLTTQQAGFTSDTGWGCMIRSGQSLLANTFAILFLGRDWRKGTLQDQEKKLLSLFADSPTAPFSIHNFVSHGAAHCGVHPGQWFGPSATARCIAALSSPTLSSSNPIPALGLRVYVRPDDTDVYADTFLRTAKSPDGSFTPTLILLGTRLGIDRITAVYWPALKSALCMPQSIGIAGGRPSSSHYFIGVQGYHFFYLDPHFTQPALSADPDATGVATCHCTRLRRLHVTELDPSMLLAFLIRSEEDFEHWRAAVTTPPPSTEDGAKSKAIVHIHDREPMRGGEDLGAGMSGERQGAVDEVESCDEEDEMGRDEDQGMVSDGDTVVC